MPQKRWRKKIDEYVTHYKIYKNAFHHILRYIHEKDLQSLYTKWKINFWIQERDIILSYALGSLKIESKIAIDLSDRRHCDELNKAIQDFFIETRYLYERDGTATKNKDLARIHWVSPQAMKVTLQNIKDKMAQFRSHLWYQSE
jgi:hypothetical protein